MGALQMLSTSPDNWTASAGGKSTQRPTQRSRTVGLGRVIRLLARSIMWRTGIPLGASLALFGRDLASYGTSIAAGERPSLRVPIVAATVTVLAVAVWRYASRRTHPFGGETPCWWSERVTREHDLARVAAFRLQWDRACLVARITTRTGAPLRLTGPPRGRPAGWAATVQFGAGGSARAWVELPDNRTLEDLNGERPRGLIARSLHLPLPLGAPEQLIFKRSPVDASLYAMLEVAYHGLPDPESLTVDLGPAPSNHELRLAHGRSGPIVWDLDRQPHCKIAGSTGVGKGRLTRTLIGQALNAGWPVLVIDGGNSQGEYGGWTRIPWFRHIPFRAASLSDSYLAMLAEFEALTQVVDRRANLLGSLGLEKFSELVADDATPAWAQGRILVVIDEASILFAKGGDLHDQLRRMLGSSVGTALRGWRKFGVNFVVVDQITYASTFLSDGSLQQAERWAFMGTPPERFKRMVADTSTAWPWVPDGFGYGVTGVAGRLAAMEPFVVPSMTNAHVHQVVEELLDRHNLIAA